MSDEKNPWGRRHLWHWQTLFRGPGLAYSEWLKEGEPPYGVPVPSKTETRLSPLRAIFRVTAIEDDGVPVPSKTETPLSPLRAIFRVTAIEDDGALKTFTLTPVGDGRWARGATLRIGVIDPTVWERFPLGGQVTFRLDDFWPKG